MRFPCTLLIGLVITAYGFHAQATPPNYPQLASFIKADDTGKLKEVLEKKSHEDINEVGRALLVALAIGQGRPASLEALIAWGINVNRSLPFVQQGETLSITPLLYAISSRAGLPTISLLLKRGANPNLASEGLMPLSFAIGLRQYEVADFLLEHGADANGVAQMPGMNALMELAISAENDDSTVLGLARRLLAKGTDVNARGPQGGTALRFAVIAKKTSLIQEFLAAGANPNAINDKGESVLELARRKQLPDIAALLEEAGAKK